MARKALNEKIYTGKTAEGISLQFNVILNPKATISWEYNENIDVDGTQFGPSRGFTAEVGNSQNNRTQVNVKAELGENDKDELNSLTGKTIAELARTGAHEDGHVGGVPDIGDNHHIDLQNKIQYDPNNIQRTQGSGTNVLPEQRSLILKTAEEQYKP